MALDITADQYNLLENWELNKSIIKNRPFSSLYWGKIGSLPHYKLFKIEARDKYVSGLPDVGEDIRIDLAIAHNMLFDKET